MKKQDPDRLEKPGGTDPRSKSLHQGRIVSGPGDDQRLDAPRLGRLERSFREWADASPRPDVRLSRRRILIIFLLIRYTGAKLNEVLALDPRADFDADRQIVLFRSAEADGEPGPRSVQISEKLAREIQGLLAGTPSDPSRRGFGVDPGFVRRKFYERAEACGFPKRLSGPEMIRKARAVELAQGNLPLPAVQMMLGHSTPNLTSSYVSFSEEEIRQVTKLYLEREASRKTSARNAFYGKIRLVQQGDILSRVTLTTVGGHSVTTVITNDSLLRLGLKVNRLITAEVKAPWVILHQGGEEPASSAENRFYGVVAGVRRGEVNTEYTVRVPDGPELCAVVSSESGRRLAIEEGDRVWALFNCFAVVLQID